MKLADAGLASMELGIFTSPDAGDAGACHAARDTVAAIEHAGFVVEACGRFDFRATPVVAPATPRMLGIARRA